MSAAARARAPATGSDPVAGDPHYPDLLSRIVAANARLAALAAEIPPDAERYADDEMVGDDELAAIEQTSEGES